MLIDQSDVSILTINQSQAALLGEAVKDSKSFGWNVDPASVNHEWSKMVEEVQNHIGGLNWGYRVALREKQARYTISIQTIVMTSCLG